MHNPALVRVVNAARKDGNQLSRFARCFDRRRIQRTAIDIFESKKCSVVVFLDFENLNDVRVLQMSHRFSFGLSAEQCGSMATGYHHLERNRSIELFLIGKIDNARSTLANLVENFIAWNIRYLTRT